MKKLIDTIKRFQLAKVALVFLAGAILFVSTACSSGTNTMASKADSNYPDQPRPEDNGLMSGGDTQRTRRENPPTYSLDPNMRQKMKETYTPTAPKAGMNQGLDQDVRDKNNLEATAKKAERLITNAEQYKGKVYQQDKGVTPLDNLQRRATPKEAAAKIDQVVGNVSDSANEVRKGAARGFENLKDNVGSAVDDAL
jgi:hypothetical protein